MRIMPDPLMEDIFPVFRSLSVLYDFYGFKKIVSAI